MSRERELLEKIKAMPYREEPMGGQNHKYLDRQEVIAWIETTLTEQEPEQEPVATVNVWYDDGLPCFNTCWTASPVNWSVGTYYLYRKPPRQEPVYLSDDELVKNLLTHIDKTLANDFCCLVNNGSPSQVWALKPWAKRFKNEIEQAVLKANGLIKDKDPQA